jgi:hypothetical protein
VTYYQAAPVVRYAPPVYAQPAYARPVYVGGFAPSYGFSYGVAGGCVGGSCARR